jgi:hypothetical protein
MSREGMPQKSNPVDATPYYIGIDAFGEGSVSLC